MIGEGMKYIVTQYELNRYKGGFVVHEEGTWKDFIADFKGESNYIRQQAQRLADKLNKCLK